MADPINFNEDFDLGKLLPQFSSSVSPHGEFYRWSYPVIRRQFECLRAQPSDAALQQCLVSLSSWMGRGRLAKCETNGACQILEELRRLNNQEEDEDKHALKLVQKLVGERRVVAASKFLHFLKPRSFAMWDTRVARATGRKISYPDYQTYLEYLKWIRHRAKISRSDWTSLRRDAGGRTATKLRVKEFLLFQLGR